MPSKTMKGVAGSSMPTNITDVDYLLPPRSQLVGLQSESLLTLSASYLRFLTCLTIVERGVFFRLLAAIASLLVAMAGSMTNKYR